MRRFIKYLLPALLLVLCLSLAACGSGGDTGNDTDAAPDSFEGMVKDSDRMVSLSDYGGTWAGDDGSTMLVEAGGDGDEVLHARVRAHGLYRAPRRSDLGDGVFLGLPDVHDAEPLERPEQIAFGDDALIVPLRVEDGQRGIAGVFHALHRLPQRGIRVDVGAHRLGRQKEQDIHRRKGPPF